MNFFAVICVLATIGLANCAPNGAPAAACATMTPQHGRDPQSGPSPFMTIPFLSLIMMNDTAMLADTFMPITFAAVTDVQFKGFLAMAFEKDNEERGPIGTFYPMEKAQILDCLNGTGNAVTHYNNEAKTSASANWMPPRGFTGKVVFKTTYVLDVNTFWVKTESTTIDVVSWMPSSARQVNVWAGLIFLLTSVAVMI